MNLDRIAQRTEGAALAHARHVCVGVNVDYTALQRKDGTWVPIAKLRSDQIWMADRIQEKGIYPVWNDGKYLRQVEDYKP